MKSKLVENVLVGEIKMEVERRSLRIFCLRISHPRCGNCCVCDGEVYTHSVSHAHFSDIFPAWRTDIAYSHGSKCLQCACHVSPSHLLPSHVSSTVFAVPTRSSRHLVPVCTFLAERFPIRKCGSSALPHERREFDYMADPTPQVMSPKITSADGDTTPINDPNYDNISDFSKITRENTGLFGVSAMLEASVSHVSHGERKDSTHRENVARQREKKEKVLWLVLLNRCQRKVDGTVLGFIFFGLKQNYILMDEISEKTWNEELNKLFLVKIQLREKIIFDWVRPGDSELRAKKFTICVDWVATRAWISKTTITGSQSMGRSSSAWENTIVQWLGDEEPSSPGMPRKKLRRNWRIEKTLLQRRKWSNSTKVEWIFYAGSGISNSELITGSSSEITRTIGIHGRFDNLPRSWLTEQFWQCPRFTSSSYSLELQTALPRIQNAAQYTRGDEYSRKRFWLSTFPTSAWRITQWFKKFGSIIGHSEKRRNWEKCEWKAIATRGLLEGKESHTRVAVDQANRSSQIAGWPHHSKINSRQRFPWSRRVGFDDGVGIEKVLRHANTLPKDDQCRGAESSEGQPITQRETNCLCVLWIFSTYWILWWHSR